MADYITQDALLCHTNSVMLVKWEKADKYFEANGGNNNRAELFGWVICSQAAALLSYKETIIRPNTTVMSWLKRH